MGRVLDRLESCEPVLQHQAGLAQEAQLIGCGHDDQRTCLGNPGNFAEEGARILEVLDRFRGDDQVSGSVFEREPAIEIGQSELDVRRELVVAKQIATYVSVDEWREAWPQVAAPTADVDRERKPTPCGPDSTADHPEDGVFTPPFRSARR